MWAVWVGMAVLFLCIGVWFWSRARRPDQTELAAEEQYAREVNADQEADEEGR
jgi:hypothetical protein